MARMGYTNEDLTNLLLIYGECRKNATAACNIFADRYPNKNKPSRDTIRRLVNNCNIFGQFRYKTERIRPVTNNEMNEVNVLAYMRANPNSSTRAAAEQLQISWSAVKRILKKHKYHAYSYLLVQELKPLDLQKRREFCENLLIHIQEDAQFLSNIIWTDEAKFSKEGIYNHHNYHYWSDRNPKVIRSRGFQTNFSFNVFCAIRNDRVVGLYFYNENLNTQVYLHILRTVVSEYLDNVPLNELRDLWFQHDGAPAHNNNMVANELYHMFSDRWWGTNGPWRWPPRSPDLTPMDFYLWGYIKCKVYETEIGTREELEERVRNAFDSLTRDEIRKATHEAVIRRTNFCIHVNGNHFQQELN